MARHGGSSRAFDFGPDGSCVYAFTRESDNVTNVVWLDAEAKFQRTAQLPPPVPLNPGVNVGVRSVRINADGSIWLSGFAGSAWVAKLTAAGILDQTFGIKGVVSLPQQTAQLIGGRANGGGIVKVSTQISLFALTSSGQIDSTFGQAGSIALPAARNFGYQVRRDGSILVATNTGPPLAPLRSFGLQRITSIGGIDRGFGVGKSPSTAPASHCIFITVPKPGSTIDVLEFEIASIVESGGKLTRSAPPRVDASRVQVAKTSRA